MANEDADFGLQFLKYFMLGGIDESLMTVYGSGVINKTSYSMANEWHVDGIKRFLKKNLDEFEKDPREFAYQCRLAAKNFYFAGHKKEAKYMLQQAWIIEGSKRSWFYWFIVNIGLYKPYYFIETKLIRMLKV